MRLGIMVTADRHLEQVCALAEAALGRGHSVSVFATGEGVGLLAEPRFVSLGALPGVTMSYCEHSALRHGVVTRGLPATVVRGSQLDNAIMCTESDKVVVL